MGLTIEKYLRGKVGFDIPDNALETIFIDRTSLRNILKTDNKKLSIRW